MSTSLLALSWMTPMLMLPLLGNRYGPRMIALAALPALLASVMVPAGSALDIPWLLLGLSLHLDPIGASFLLFSSAMWLFAGLYATIRMHGDAHFARFALFFLLACSGNLLLILAADIVTFYVGFALMGLAATGLIAHRRSQHARRAARVYLAWTLVGEMALFAAVVMLAQRMGTFGFADLTPEILNQGTVALLLFGFGIKLALPGLHVWLPLAYRAAPAAAAAVLSGPMISAGLLGWIRFLPAGSDALLGWGEILLMVGVIGTALGVLAGLMQRDPRAVLGYSSIAKMGLATGVFAVAQIHPDMAPGIVAALVMFAMHHLLLKGTLFLGLGEWQQHGNRPWLLAALGVLALAMMGAPLTSGAGAKIALTEATAASSLNLALLFGFSAIGTTLLMARMLWLLAQRGAAAEFQYASVFWLLTAASAVLMPLIFLPLPLSSSGLGMIAIGLAITLLVWRAQHRSSFSPPTIPPGDVLCLVGAAYQLSSSRLQFRDLRFSPVLLTSQASLPVAIRRVGILLWFVLGISLLAVGLMPG